MGVAHWATLVALLQVVANRPHNQCLQVVANRPHKQCLQVVANHPPETVFVDSPLGASGHRRLFTVTDSQIICQAML